MKINELASDYLTTYEDNPDVIITAVSEFEFDNKEFATAFDLSDGTSWFNAYNDNYQLKESLVGSEIVWIEEHGWAVLNDDGSHTEIALLEGFNMSPGEICGELGELYLKIEKALDSLSVFYTIEPLALKPTDDDDQRLGVIYEIRDHIEQILDLIRVTERGLRYEPGITMTIREILKATGMTQKALAERFDIPFRTVQNWANGQRECPVYIRKMIMENLRLR